MINLAKINFANFGKRLFNSSFSGLLVSVALGFGSMPMITKVAYAQSRDIPPAELSSMMDQIEDFANDRNLQGLLGFYSRDFENSDGLRYSTLGDALVELWRRYPDLNYDIEILSWQMEGSQLVVETRTTLRGTEVLDGREFRLDSTMISRQYFRRQQQVKQEILSEDTQILSGDMPPEVTVNLPNTVRVSDRADFDVIVNEPLKQDLLLGAVLEDIATSNGYFDPSILELDALDAGGIFKQFIAPLIPDNRWLSAIIVQGNGMTIVTRRVRIIGVGFSDL